MSEQFPHDRRFGSSSSSKGKATSKSLEQENNEECLMRDIFQVLSEIPLNATETSQDYNYEQHFGSSSTKDDEVCFEEDKGETKLHENMQIVVPGCQNDQRRAREQRRREHINVKMRELKALIPGLDKEDKASILDGAIKYINSLKLQLQVLSAQSRSVVGMEFQARCYMPPMMHTCGNIPWPQFQITTTSSTTPYNHSGFPIMISPPPRPRPGPGPANSQMNNPSISTTLLSSSSPASTRTSTSSYSQLSTSSHQSSYQTYNYNHKLFDF